MPVCVPEPLLYGLLVAAVGRDLARNGGIRSLWASDGGRRPEGGDNTEE